MLCYPLTLPTSGSPPRVRDVDPGEDGTRRADGRLPTEEVLEDIVPIVDQRYGPVDHVVFVPESEIKLVTSLKDDLTVLFYFLPTYTKVQFLLQVLDTSSLSIINRNCS